MDDPRNIPAVKFTSCHLYSKSPKANSNDDKAPVASTALLGCGAVIHPFHHYNADTENVSYRTPILCIFCGGFLSIHALINPKTGEWCCPLCRNTNPMFHNLQSSTNSTSKLLPSELNYDQLLRETYPELQSKHVDYHEILSDLDMTASAYNDKHNPLLHPLHVFAVDRSLLHVISSVNDETDELTYDNTAIDLLIEGLQQLTPSTKVSIFVYDSAIHLLRLSSIDTNPVVTMDVLPGNSNGSGADCNTFIHFTCVGFYYNTAEILLANVAHLRAALCNMTISRPSSLYEAVNHSASSSNSSTIYCKCSINTMIQTALSMRGVHVPIQNSGKKAKSSSATTHSSDKFDLINNTSTRLIFIADRLLPISMSNPIHIKPHSAAALLLGGGGGEATGGTSNESKLPTLVSNYLNIGKYAYTNNMSIDVFYQTKHHDYSQVIDKFQALVCPSGGSFIRSETLKDSAVQESFCALMRYNQLPEQLINYVDHTRDGEESYKYVRDTRASNMATIQIRTSGEINVNQIVGYVQPAEDVIYYRNCAAIEKDDKILSVSQITCDYDQLTSTLMVLDSQNTPDVFPVTHPIHKKLSSYGDNTDLPDKDDSKVFSNKSESIYYRLMQSHVDNNIVVSGVPSTSLQYHPSTMLSITFDHTPESEGRSKFSPTQAVQQLLGTPTINPATNVPVNYASVVSDLPMYNTETPGSSTPTTYASNEYDSYGTSSAEKEAYLNGVFIQFIVNYNQFNLTGGPTSTSAATVASVSRVTRVYTLRIEKTNDFEEFVEGFDETLYGMVTSRSIVADYHNNCMSSFSGVRKHKLDEQGNYLFANLRDNAGADVDRLVRNVCKVMHSSNKALTICRMLHHLKEGPLLDGPSMQPVDAYLLRTLFLNAPYFHTLRILMPSVKLVCLPTNESVESTPKENVPVDPTIVYPPPPVAPPSLAVPVYAPPSGPPPTFPSSGSVTPATHPPPPGAPSHPPSLSLYLPPSSPHPSVLDNSIHSVANSVVSNKIDSTTATVAVSYARHGIASGIGIDDRESVVLYAVLPDSMSLLPNTVALIDYGDVIIIRVNTPTQKHNNVENGKEDNKEQKLETIIEQLTVIADKNASSRFPVATVHRINSKYSPLDRLVFSRLSPNHMDTMNNLLRMYGTDPAASMRSFLPKYAGLTESDIDNMILHTPITDQLYLSKYLFNVSPNHASIILKNLFAVPSSSGSIKNNKVDSQTVSVKPAVVKAMTPLTPALSGAMEREGELTSTLQQAELSLEDNKLSMISKPQSNKEETDSANKTTVWNDISSIFGSINPFKKVSANDSEENVVDFADNA